MSLLAGVTALADGATALVELVGVALLHGTVLAAIAWLLSITLLRRARPAVIAAVWTIALVKFAIPIGPAMPWSISGLLAALVAGTDAPAHAAPVAATTAPVVATSALPGLLSLVALAGVVLWLAAVVIIVARRVRAQRAAFARAMSLPPAPAPVAEVLHRVATRLGLRRLPALRLDPHGASPWVAGIRRPVVVVPASLVERTSELTAALAHELAHLRRRDAWLRLAQVAVGALFFFWPVVRWVNRRIDVAREMACDAYAVAHGPLPARDYARMLVRLVRGASGAPDGAFALAATPRLLRGRVDALLGARPDAAPGIGKLGAVGLAAWTAIALGGASRASAAPGRGEVCVFTPALASSILAAHPEADADGDGHLSRAEACEYQLELRRRIVDDLAPTEAFDPAFDVDGDGALSSAEAEQRRDRLAQQLSGPALAATSPLAAESLCCNCGDGEGTSTPPTGFIFRAGEPANTCVRGVDP